MSRLYLAAAALVLGLPGCAFGPQPAPPIAVYDFGPHAPKPSVPRVRATLAMDDVTAHPQLHSTAILYRLIYQDAAQLMPYSRSRWAAAPPVLLGQRLRLALGQAAERGVVAVADGVRSDYVLRVELDAFEHLLDSANAGRVSLRLRASLIGSPERSLRAQRAFSAERVSDSADARGAVRALGAASDQVIDELIAWIVQETAGPR